MGETITEMTSQEAPAEPIAAEEPVCPAPEAPADHPQEEVISPKPKKKLNKKILIIGIAAAVVIALVIGLVALLGGGTKNTGVFIQDGELYLYVEGMKEPVELTSRLWKGADDNADFASIGTRLISLVNIRNNGQLVFYPDKFDSSNNGYTIFVKNVSKSKEDPVKIASDISWYYVTEDGKQMLYAKYDDRTSTTLYLYDVKTEEEIRLAKDVANATRVTYAEDLSSICFLRDGDLYLWTAKTEDVKIAKHISGFSYKSETGMVFATTQDGELLMKTAEMEECEEVADHVFRLMASYPNGEAYFLRVVETERCLLDYLDDDMKAEDASISQPRKPNYPTAPQKVYYWNYPTDEAYQAAKAQYDIDYAAYQ